MKKTILLCISLCICLAGFSQITGNWKGSLALPGTALTIIFNIENHDSSYSLTMDIPDQGLIQHPASKTRFENRKLQVTFSELNIQYVGTLSEDEQMIHGTFLQNGFELPLNFELTSTQTKSSVHRPQTPIPTDAYISEDITFINKKENITLAGTLTLPKNYTSKTPIAILISGSGAQDRNSTIMGHQPFYVIADYLTKRGIGVLRYDDRGVGGSDAGAAPSEATTANFAADAHAAITYIHQRGFKKAGFIGHSEGGIIAPMVAATHPKQVQFLILLAAQGVPGDSIIVHQTYTGSLAEGVQESVATFNRNFTRKLTQYVKHYPGSNLVQDLSVIIDQALQSDDPIAASISAAERNNIKQTVLPSMTAPWTRYFMQLDPAVYLSKVKCPILVIHGTNDVQIPYPENQDAIRQILTTSKHKNFQLLTLDKGNHLLQTSTSGAISEYVKIEETIAPFVLESMYKWLEKL